MTGTIIGIKIPKVPKRTCRKREPQATKKKIAGMKPILKALF